MKIKLSFFSKINLLIISLIVPIIGLTAYLTNTGNSVLKSEIQLNNLSYLSLINSEIDANINQLSTFAVTLISDSAVREFARPFVNPYDRVKTYLNLEEKIKLNNASAAWKHHITIYAPQKQEAFFMDGLISYDEVNLQNPLSLRWTYIDTDNEKDGHFILDIVGKKFDNPNRTDHELIIELVLPTDDIKAILNKIKTDGRGDPFFFSHENKALLLNSTANQSLTEDLLNQLDLTNLKVNGSQVVVLNQKKHMVMYEFSRTLGWYLFNYIPVEDIMAPITKSLQIFYATLIVLVILAFLASFIFYKNVQLPIRSLVSRLRAVAKGNYSVRLDRTSNYEFQFLNDQFNHMAQQIEELIETDYKSQIRLQEAGLRLLQSQIDPHFLYNCLFFIKNNARLGNEEGVVAMSLNLGMYYRYSTKLSNSETSIREELEMIENYLNIHNLRLNRIRYEIEFPDDMMNLQIPRLLLQPIVENAIIHGIEPKMREGLIKLRGISLIDEYQIIIEDNGTGISDQQLDELLKHINFHNPGTSFGLWNINQRMKIRFGGNSQLYCSSSALGGLKISLVWKKQTGE